MTPEAAVLREDYKRAAYNALAAAILCTQRKEDFFRQFLFRDNDVKKEYVWENIVDLTVRTVESEMDLVGCCICENFLSKLTPFHFNCFEHDVGCLSL